MQRYGRDAQLKATFYDEGASLSADQFADMLNEGVRQIIEWKIPTKNFAGFSLEQNRYESKENPSAWSI